MELTDKHLEEIKKAARTVEYGAITLNIAANSKTLELNVQNRFRLEIEPAEYKDHKKT